MTRLAWALAFGSGFLSLSEEILWVRFMGFAQQGVPQAFSLVLGLYLLGIALGAAVGKRVCQSALPLPLAAAGVLASAGGLDLAVPALLVVLAPIDPFPRYAALGALITLASALKAVLFPVAHHLGSRVDSARLGRSLSWVYGMNIAGSTLGPLLVGFVFLDWITMEAAFRGIGVACLVLAAGCLVAFSVPPKPRQTPALRALAVLLAGGALAALAGLNPKDTSVIRAYAAHVEGAAVKAVISNRHGVLHTVEGGAMGDVVYGGNVYDGRTNTDLRVNSNLIDRAYLLTSLRPAPKRLLVIGLSTGAWLRVLAAQPSLEQIDVIEINPGYLSLIRGYPNLEPMLSDPRVRIHIDDGRRWLRRHAGERYDQIAMNTTFHWRANATNLLSRQFLELARQHLAPGGLMAFNATGSPDALYTAATVFEHAYLWRNFIYAADEDFRPAHASPAARDRLAALRLDGRVPLVNPAEPADAAALDALFARPFVTVAEVAAEVAAEAGRPLEVIDDAQMQTEFRYGRGLALDR